MHRSRVRNGMLGWGLCVALIAAGPAAAKAPLIKGKLSDPGYRVIALSAGGDASFSPVGRQRLRLGSPAKKVSLHLRAADGTYAGPIVVGKERKGKRAVIGVKAPVNLGDVEVKAAGYARLSEKLADESLDISQQALAAKGVPIGAGSFGRVPSANLRGPPSDPDYDGIPDPLDIDDDGDLVLDNIDRTAGVRTALSASPNQFHLVSELAAPIYDTVNANSPAFSDAQIEAALPNIGRIILEILPGAATELDCGGLLYCSAAGTGRFPTVLNPPEGNPFPGPPGGPFDADGDGFGRLTPGPGSVPGMYLLHGARARDPGLDPTISQIGSGDLLSEHVTNSGDQSQCPPPTPIPECSSFLSTLGFVFSTVPAVASFNDETAETQVPYPIAGPYTGPPPPQPSGPGTLGNGFPVKDSAGDADEDVELTFTIWRPQRRPIPDELCSPPPDRPCTTEDWIDIGGLTYSPGVSHFGNPPQEGVFGDCPQSSLATVDPNLVPQPSPPPPGESAGYVDGALDQRASATNTLTYTLNLTQCLASMGVSPWPPGKEVGVTFRGRDVSFDSTEQGISFTRQP